MLNFWGVFWHMLFGDAILDLRMPKVIADEHGIDPTGTLDHVLWNRKEMKKTSW